MTNIWKLSKINKREMVIFYTCCGISAPVQSWISTNSYLCSALAMFVSLPTSSPVPPFIHTNSLGRYATAFPCPCCIWYVPCDLNYPDVPAFSLCFSFNFCFDLNNFSLLTSLNSQHSTVETYLYFVQFSLHLCGYKALRYTGLILNDNPAFSSVS